MERGAALWGPEGPVSQAEGTAHPEGTRLACPRSSKSSRVAEWSKRWGGRQEMLSQGLAYDGVSMVEAIGKCRANPGDPTNRFKAALCSVKRKS